MQRELKTLDAQNQSFYKNVEKIFWSFFNSLELVKNIFFKFSFLSYKKN